VRERTDREQFLPLAAFIVTLFALDAAPWWSRYTF
jgi:hypothetical protein